MPEVKGLSFHQQDRCMIERGICHHSKAILQLGENFRSRYKKELPSDINSFDGTNNACLFNSHRKTAVMRSDNDPNGMCLVAYQNRGKVSLLYTVSSRNKIPLCTQYHGDNWAKQTPKCLFLFFFSFQSSQFPKWVFLAYFCKIQRFRDQRLSSTIFACRLSADAADALMLLMAGALMLIMH